MPSVTCSAPGKIILFGEHAVVYGRPALAVPVNQVQARATLRPNRRGEMFIEAPDIHLAARLADLETQNPLAVVIAQVAESLGLAGLPACTLTIRSTIPVASGMGSGAAVAVAVIRALGEYMGQPFNNEQVNALAFEAEKIHHGTPSGIDNTVITYQRPISFTRGQPVAFFSPPEPFYLLIADSGIPAPTREAVAGVRALWQADAPRWEKVFDQIAGIVGEARRAIEAGDWQRLGTQMDANHTCLQELTVSCPELDHLVETSRRAGALGAKMSGGGRGGNMVALVARGNAPAIARALIKAGARRTILTRVE